MIPLRDNIRSRTTPWMNYLLIGLNAAVFMYELGLDSPADMEVFFFNWGLVPSRFMSGLEGDSAGLLQLAAPWFTSMFIHGGWFHVIGNMWFLWIFGDNVEDRMGPLPFLLFYLGGGLAAAFSQVFACPDSSLPMVGASGAISAVLAAYMVLYPKARIVTLVPLFIFLQFMELPAWVFLGLWFLFQYASGTFSPEAEGGTAWWAHVGGFIAGIPLVFVFCKDRCASIERREKPGSITVIPRRRA